MKLEKDKEEEKEKKKKRKKKRETGFQQLIFDKYCE